jgi:hypothetical protein
MYIRRKVFSVLQDESGEERLFSTTEFMNEDSYLDEREFGIKEVAKGAADKVVSAGKYVGGKAVQGGKFVGNAVASGAKYVGSKVAAGGKYVGGKAVQGGKFVGNAVASGAKYVGSKVAAGGKYVGGKAAAGGKVTADAAKKAAAAVAKYAQEHPNAKLTAEITGGALAATGAAYGGYKLYDHIKNKNKD